MQLGGGCMQNDDSVTMHNMSKERLFNLFDAAISWAIIAVGAFLVFVLFKNIETVIYLVQYAQYRFFGILLLTRSYYEVVNSFLFGCIFSGGLPIAYVVYRSSISIADAFRRYLAIGLSISLLAAFAYAETLSRVGKSLPLENKVEWAFGLGVFLSYFFGFFILRPELSATMETFLKKR
jgi:hypothetical protein